jgi:hypothetical protein
MGCASPPAAGRRASDRASASASIGIGHAASRKPPSAVLGPTSAPTPTPIPTPACSRSVDLVGGDGLRRRAAHGPWLQATTGNNQQPAAAGGVIGGGGELGPTAGRGGLIARGAAFTDRGHGRVY